MHGLEILLQWLGSTGVQMGAFSLPKPPALELHCSAASPADHLLQDEVVPCL